MKFTFAHAADVHLDSPLHGLGAYGQEMADCFRQASRRAFVNLVDAVIERHVSFLVIAGDIFDGDWKDYSTGLFFVQQMGRLDRAGIPVYALSGNHDAATEISKSLRYPGNVRFFDSRKPETFVDEATGATLHGQGFHDKWSDQNIALNYPLATPGVLNIGVLHTAFEGSADHATYAPCSVEQLCNHGYDYWALGHVHAHAVVCDDPYVVFSGNLQGRHIRECGPKGFCLVEVTDHAVTSFEHVCCDVARWHDLSIAVDDEKCPDLPMLLNLVQDGVSLAVAEAQGRPLALRLTITGDTKLHRSLMGNQADLRAQVVATASSVSDEVMLEKLRVKTREPATLVPASAEHQDLILELTREMDSPELATTLGEELGQVLSLLRGKLPFRDGVLPEDEELAEIVAEAKSLVAARLSHAGGATDDAN